MMAIQTSLRSVESEFWGDINLEIVYLSVLNLFHVQNMHMYLVTIPYL